MKDFKRWNVIFDKLSLVTITVLVLWDHRRHSILFLNIYLVLVTEFLSPMVQIRISFIASLSLVLMVRHRKQEVVSMLSLKDLIKMVLIMEIFNHMGTIQLGQ
jgi:hypothetical protein